MTRMARVQYPGALFHVMTRGNQRGRTFRTVHDYRVFLSFLGEAVERFRWILYTYALMPNHVHLVLQLTEETFSTGMHWLDGEYAKYFNRRYGRVGHFFQNRPLAPLVDKDTYFLTLLRYIALNPVEGGLCRQPEDYEWSAHRALSGRVPAPAWLAVDDALIAFAPQRDHAQRLYTNFVDEGIGIPSPIEGLEEEPYLGSKEWMRSVREKLELKPRFNELALRQRRVGRADANDIIAAVANALGEDTSGVRLRRDGDGRMLVAWLGFNEGLLRKSAIARELRISETTVKRLIDECEAARSSDSRVRESLESIVARLRQRPAGNITR